MIQEYLLLDEQEKKRISEYKPDDVESNLFSLPKGKCWYAQYICEGNNESSAKYLSSVDCYVREHFQVIVLRNDSSEYFNNRLYPIISSFERKLRKLLYIFSAINKEDEASKNIDQLEEKDFGQIFTMLFIDDEYMNKTKEVVKNTQRDKFSKKDIIRLINELDEETVWDRLIGRDIVPTLRNCFQEVRSIRNDVMHSHNISWEKYKKGKRLMETINSEIEIAINDVSVKEDIAKKTPSYNQILSEALSFQEQFKLVMEGISGSEALREIKESARIITQAYQSNPGLQEAQRNLSKVAQMICSSPELLELQFQAGKVAQVIQNLKLDSNIDTKKNGGFKNGEDEDGNGGYDDEEYRKD